MPERSLERNAGYIEYVRSHALNAEGNQISQSRIAAKIGVGRAMFSQIKAGDKRVSACLMLKTLQIFPPKDWAEFAAVGEVWDKPKPKRSTLTEPAKGNRFLFDYIAQRTSEPITVTELGIKLGVSRTYIASIRSGKNPVSEKIMGRVVDQFPPHDADEAICIRKAWEQSRQNRNTEPAERNRFLFDFIAPKGVVTDAQLASLLGVSSSLIHMIRAGEEGVSRQFMLKVFKHFTFGNSKEVTDLLEAWKNTQTK